MRDGEVGLRGLMHVQGIAPAPLTTIDSFDCHKHVETGRKKSFGCQI